MNLDIYLALYIKTNSKWAQHNVNVNFKIFRQNIRGNFCY